VCTVPFDWSMNRFVVFREMLKKMLRVVCVPLSISSRMTSEGLTSSFAMIRVSSTPNSTLAWTNRERLTPVPIFPPEDCFSNCVYSIFDL